MKKCYTIELVMYMKKKIVIMLLLLCTLLTGCGKDTYGPVKPGETGNKDNNEPVVNQKLKIVDVNSKSRPVAVMINNLSAARPVQSRVMDAYIVYEIIVEGGITRYMAVYKDKDTAKIVIPLDFDIPTLRRAPVSSIPTVFTKCFKLSRYRPLHIKEVWHKNTKYYGGCGCFFSSDKTPLIFVTATGNITKEDATYTGIRFYFHPNIFTSENPIEKYIFKNILPAAVRDADGGIGFYPGSAVNYVPVEVLIKDISERFIKAPTIVDEVDDDNINAFLKGNIEDIYKILNISDTSSK